MLLEGILWTAALTTVGASPLPCALGICGVVESLVSAVCEMETALWPCSGPPNHRNAPGASSSLLYAPSIARRQNPNDGSSKGPPLGPILGGVLGAVGGLAIAGAIFYAWWSIRRVRQRHEGNQPGASSSFGTGARQQQSASKDSRGSSSGSRQSQKKAARGWQDPWLAPAAKSPRPVSVVKLERVIGVPGSGKVVQDDQGSDSSAVPLKVMHSNIEEEQGKAVRGEV